MPDDFSAESLKSGAVDLFGHKVMPIKDRRGRPSFKKTKENQDFVAVRVAAGWAVGRIAEDMGCDEKTLRKYFSRELQAGAMMIEGLALDVLLAKSRQGHVPSIKELGARLEQTKIRPPAPTKQAPKPALGKKAEAIERAGKPTGGWGDRLNSIDRAN